MKSTIYSSLRFIVVRIWREHTKQKAIILITSHFHATRSRSRSCVYIFWTKKGCSCTAPHQRSNEHRCKFAGMTHDCFYRTCSFIDACNHSIHSLSPRRITRSRHVKFTTRAQYYSIGLFKHTPRLQWMDWVEVKRSLTSLAAAGPIFYASRCKITSSLVIQLPPTTALIHENIIRPWELPARTWIRTLLLRSAINMSSQLLGEVDELHLHATLIARIKLSRFNF